MGFLVIRKHYQRIGSKLVLIEQSEQPAGTVETKPAKAKAKPVQAETEPTIQPDKEAIENDSSNT